ncbi:MAG: AAA family ATPase [Acidobacteriota bacterium]|nr:AAA family ATPase [Acidobacteriota bacterium]
MFEEERGDLAVNKVSSDDKSPTVEQDYSVKDEPQQHNSERMLSVHDVLSKLRGVRESGGEWSAKCPAHDDQQNSLSVGVGTGGKLLIHCHAGCPYEHIVAKLGLTANGSGPRRIAKVYDYCDERGELLYQAVRYEPKDFGMRRPDGCGGFIYNIKGVPRILYRLPELVTAQQGQPILIVEGEKDADRLAELGFVATTNVGGALKWRNEYSESLCGLPAIIIPDNDDAGYKHAEKVARSLLGKAASIKVIELPGLPPKGDVSDWLNAGNTPDALHGLVAATPFFDSRLTPIGKPENRENRESEFTLTPLDKLLDEPQEEVSYVWDKTLPCGGFSICAAKPKVGKSTLARNLAVNVSQGSDFFGRSTTKGQVIYLCLEEKRAEVASHFRRMGAGGSDIFIHTGSAPDDALAALEGVIHRLQPVLVVIDPLSRFVRLADFNSYGEVTRALEPLIDLARRSGCHILAVHHNGKGERDGGDALLGSTGFFGAVDTLITMKRREQARTVQTTQRYGEDLPETVAYLDQETGVVKLGGDMATIQVDKRVADVLDAIGDETLTEADIKERVGGNQTLTAKAIRTLFDSGRLTRIGAGRRGNPYYYAKSTVTLIESSILDSAVMDNPENRENPATAPIDDGQAEAEICDHYYQSD